MDITYLSLVHYFAKNQTLIDFLKDFRIDPFQNNVRIAPADWKDR